MKVAEKGLPASVAGKVAVASSAKLVFLSEVAAPPERTSLSVTVEMNEGAEGEEPAGLPALSVICAACERWRR